jgi:O-antigen/teichoic acid export membrane protein
VSNYRSLFRIDGAVSWNLAAYAVSALMGPLGAFLVVSRLTTETQGFYYTFSSIIAMQVLLELGFGFCITQFVSHEFAHLTMGPERRLAGNPEKLARLVAIARVAAKWYAVAGLLLFFGIGGIGHQFFSNHSGDSTWRSAWWLLCAGSAISILSVPFFAVLEGCGQIAWTARLRFLQSVIRSSAILGLLWSGGGLFALGIGSLFGVAVLAVLVWHWRSLTLQFYKHASGSELSWFREIWPFQWRIAVSWGSGYLIYSCFNPMVFAAAGSAEAGRFGLTWSLIQAISAASAIFINTKQPLFSSHAARGEWSAMRAVWSRSVVQAMSICAVGSIVFLILTAIFVPITPYADRFLKTPATLLLLAAAVLNQFTFSVAALVRAEKREPFLWMSLAWGFLVLGGGWLVIGRFGIVGLASVYTSGSIILAIYAVWVLRTESAFARPL